MTTYKDAGVDIVRGEVFVEGISGLVKKTWSPEVKSDIGDFAALYSLLGYSMEHPLLVSSTDGVGTKIKIAIEMNRHDTVGIDLVAMCVNDILVKGAKPLFFLDYLACSELDTTQGKAILAGIAKGCEAAGCALVGGETAEMPGMYQKGDYDLAGFVVGIVDSDRLIDGTDISAGDAVIGIASSGLHSNGFSLIRKIIEESADLALDTDIPELAAPLGEVLLAPTKIYARTVASLIRDFNVKGMAHITGGGIPGNCVRILPGSAAMRIKKDSWPLPPVFKLFKEKGNLSEEELVRTFNCGIGMVAVVAEHDADELLLRLQGLGETAWLIGDIVPRREKDPAFLWVEQA